MNREGLVHIFVRHTEAGSCPSHRNQLDIETIVQAWKDKKDFYGQRMTTYLTVDIYIKIREYKKRESRNSYFSDQSRLTAEDPEKGYVSGCFGRSLLGFRHKS